MTDKLTAADRERKMKIRKTPLYQGYPRRTVGSLSIKERLEEYIFYSQDGCWYWIGYVCKDGYGQITITTDDHKYKSKAHRIAYQIYKGDIPKGMYVLHSCDNPRCVNPDHLSVGTQKDNIQDMFRKGRSRSHRTVKLP